MNIIYFLLLLSIIVIIHEAGHLIAAKSFGVYCYEFSFGMGPLLWKKKTKETQYSLRLLPIGGYVAMAGETDGDEAYPDVVVPDDRRLNHKKPWQKIIIMLAGVFMNFVLAWVIFSLYLLSIGSFYQSPKAIVVGVMQDSPAQLAGFQEGDVIVEIQKEDGSSVKPDTYLDMQVFSSGYSGVETYTVKRGDETVTIAVTPQYNEETETYMIGIQAPKGNETIVNLVNCWGYGFQEMGSITRLMLTTIAGLIFHGSGMDQMSGPVGIYQAAGTYAAMGFGSFMFLVAQLSLNVGIFNLLPLPVLDGGQVVITVIEWIFHRELNTKVKTIIMLACWVVLIGLMLFVTWNDIARLIMK